MRDLEAFLAINNGAHMNYDTGRICLFSEESRVWGLDAYDRRSAYRTFAYFTDH